MKENEAGSFDINRQLFAPWWKLSLAGFCCS